MLDPALRDDPASITSLRYCESLKRFHAWCGGVRIREIKPIALHVGQTSEQYGDRDFARVEVIWQDKHGTEHILRERWVRDQRGRWYTRSTGFVTPESE
jgi:hypothetical protein